MPLLISQEAKAIAKNNRIFYERNFKKILESSTLSLVSHASAKKSIGIILKYYFRNFFGSKSLIEAIPEIKELSEEYCQRHPDNSVDIDFMELNPIIQCLSESLENLLGNVKHPYSENLTMTDMLRFAREAVVDDNGQQLLPLNHLRPVAVTLSATYLRTILRKNKEWKEIQKNSIQSGRELRGI